MTQNVSVPLADRDYQYFKRLAAAQHRDVGEIIAAFLAQHTPPADAEAGNWQIGNDSDLIRERSAYERLHPQLRETHAGHYVAIHGGKLVDHDQEYARLFERVDAAYPDTFVWMTQVDDEPVRTIHFRSPSVSPN